MSELAALLPGIPFVLGAALEVTPRVVSGSNKRRIAIFATLGLVFSTSPMIEFFDEYPKVYELAHNVTESGPLETAIFSAFMLMMIGYLLPKIIRSKVSSESKIEVE